MQRIDAYDTNHDVFSSSENPGERLYNLDVERCAPDHPVDEQQRPLIDRARAGDRPAREQIILSCLKPVRREAYRVARFHDMDAMDVLEVGNLALVEWVDRALSRPCPFGYLLTAAYRAMRTYCKQYGHSLIKTPLATDGSALPAIAIDSLDCPIGPDQDITLAEVLSEPAQVEQVERDYTPLYQALEQLAPAQRHVLIRLYGLYDTLPQTVAELAAERGENSKQHRNAVMATESYAYARLRAALRVQPTLHLDPSFLERKQGANRRKGEARRIDPQTVERARRLYADNSLSAEEICSMLAISTATLKRYVRGQSPGERKERAHEGCVVAVSCAPCWQDGAHMHL